MKDNSLDGNTDSLDDNLKEFDELLSRSIIGQGENQYELIKSGIINSIFDKETGFDKIEKAYYLGMENEEHDKVVKRYHIGINKGERSPDAYQVKYRINCQGH